MFTARLANFVSGTPSPQTPKDVLRCVGIALIDTVGGSLAGSGEAVVDGAPQEAAPYGGLANAVVLGHDRNFAAPVLCPGQ
jgi:2-methylcitrate dehydratase PrpD